MRIEQDSKRIAQGELYVRHGDFYVVGGAEYKDILSTLAGLVSSNPSSQKFLVVGVKAYLFDFVKGVIRVYEKEDAEVLLAVEPQIKACKVGECVGKVKKKGLSIDKRQVIIAGILFLVVVGVFKVYSYYKQKREEELARKRQQEMAMKVQSQKPVLPPCTSNVRSFFEKFVFPAQVRNAQIYIQGSSGIAVVVPLEEQQDVRVGSRIRIVSPSEDITKGQDSLGVYFQLNNYYQCLEFISLNKELPLTVEELTDNSCRIRIKGGCLYEEVNVNS